jgi:hypothetical protein
MSSWHNASFIKLRDVTYFSGEVDAGVQLPASRWIRVDQIHVPAAFPRENSSGQPLDRRLGDYVEKNIVSCPCQESYMSVRYPCLSGGKAAGA